jgi:hypothetical protein
LDATALRRQDMESNASNMKVERDEVCLARAMAEVAVIAVLVGGGLLLGVACIVNVMGGNKHAAEQYLNDQGIETRAPAGAGARVTDFRALPLSAQAFVPRTHPFAM